MADSKPRGSRLFAVTFYSYKGGVGRSVALLNTAFQLARRGRRVVLLDFDLEAPGLYSAVRSAFHPGPRTLRREGILDYFHDFKERGEIPDLDRYLSGGFGPDNLIQLIPAGSLGDAEGYASYLAAFSFESFARDWYGRELLLHLRAQLGERGFDYLLVDSRTGHTDFIGATTVLLPHLTVLFTNLTRQSLEGTGVILKWVRKYGRASRNPRPAGAEYRYESILQHRAPSDPDLKTLVVASPVPFGGRVETAMAHEYGVSVDHVIYYVSHIAAEEANHVVGAHGKRKPAKTGRGAHAEPDDGSPRLDPAYNMYSRLAERIQAMNPDEPSTMVELGIEALSRQDWRVAIGYLDAADHFLQERPTSLGDRDLGVRLRLAEARALALGFQTEKAREFVGQDRGKPLPEDLLVDRIVALLQLVRGDLGADQLKKAAEPATEALALAERLENPADRDHWRLIAGLATADVLTLIGRYREAAKIAAELPPLARRLNRRIEVIRSLQVLATARIFVGDYRAASQDLDSAVREGSDLAVGYFEAGTYYALGLLELATGGLSAKGAERLESAARVYDQEGDSLGAANCYADLALYQHRLGTPLLRVQGSARKAFDRYHTISGTSLGQANVLLYVTRILIDHGSFESKTPLLPGPIRRSLDSAVGTLLYAELIVRNANVAGLDTPLWAYWCELELFVPGDRLARARSDLGLEALPPEHAWDAGSEESSGPEFEARRSRLLAKLVRVAPTGASGIVAELQELAAKARKLGARHEEACARALLALAHSASTNPRARGTELSRLRALAREGELSWTVFGQVRAVRDHLRAPGVGEVWKQAAASLLDEAGGSGLPTPPS